MPPQMVRLHNGSVCRVPVISMSIIRCIQLLLQWEVFLSRYGIRQRHNTLESQIWASKHGIRALQRLFSRPQAQRPLSDFAYLPTTWKDKVINLLNSCFLLGIAWGLRKINKP